MGRRSVSAPLLGVPAAQRSDRKLLQICGGGRCLMFGLALLVTAALVAGLWRQHGLVLHQVAAAEDTGIQDLRSISVRDRLVAGPGSGTGGASNPGAKTQMVPEAPAPAAEASGGFKAPRPEPVAKPVAGGGAVAMPAATKSAISQDVAADGSRYRNRSGPPVVTFWEPTLTVGQLLRQLKHSSHEIVERGATESQNVVELHDMYLIDGQLFYLSDVPVAIDPFETSWRDDLEQLKWVKMQSISEAQLRQHLAASGRWSPESPTIELPESVLWYFEAADNWYHNLAEYAVSVHHLACKHFKRCTYDSADPGWHNFSIVRLDPLGEAQQQPFPELVTQDLFPCFTQHPVLPLGHPDVRKQIVVLRKTVAGIGPQCRAFHYCCPFYRRTSLPPPAVQGYRSRLGRCLPGFDAEAAVVTALPHILLLDRSFAAGRHMLNGAAAVQHLRRLDPNATVTLAQPDGLSLAQQAALMQSATVLVQMHGASMANWLFLPQGAAVVHIIPWPGYAGADGQHGLHDWAIDLVADLPQNVSLVRLTPESSTAAVLKRQEVLNDPMYGALTPEERLNLWEHGLCPAAPPQLEERCRVNWYVRHSDMVLDLDELGGAVQNALDLIEIAEFERRAHSGEAAVKQMEN